MGTPEECAEFINFLNKIIPDKIISISNAYPNRNSIEQRVYVDLKDISRDLPNDMNTFAYFNVWSDILSKCMLTETDSCCINFVYNKYDATFNIELSDLKKIDE